jgi:hypothetical protein
MRSFLISLALVAVVCTVLMPTDASAWGFYGGRFGYGGFGYRGFYGRPFYGGYYGGYSPYLYGGYYPYGGYPLYFNKASKTRSKAPVATRAATTARVQNRIDAETR